MRLGYLWLPHLPLQIARTVFPDLSGPLLIALDERVVDADEPCLSSGVRLGMALREARELIPTAQVLTANPTRETEMAERAFEILERLSDGLELAFSPSSSPAQSSSSPSTKAPSGSPVTPQPGAPPTLPPSPLSGIEGAWFVPAGPLSEQRLAAALVDGIATALGLKAQVAIAPGKFIARIAAQRTVRDGVEIIPEDNGAAYLAPLPLTLLPLSPQTVDRLRLLNIHTIGQLSQIPAASLQRRFGQEGLIAHRLARGDDDTPLHPRRPPAVLTAGCTFEDPIEDRTTLLAAAQDLLTRLTDQLQERNETFRTLRLRVYWEEGSDEHRANLRLPTNDPGRVLPVLRTLIEGLDLPGPASSLSLRLEAITPLTLTQGTLFDRAQTERRERVERTLTEITRRYRGRVRRLVPGETPGSLFEERRLLSLPYEPDGWDQPNNQTNPFRATQTKPSGHHIPNSPDTQHPHGAPALRLQPIHLIRQGKGLQILSPAGPPPNNQTNPFSDLTIEPTGSPGWRDEIVAWHARWEADDWWPEEVRRTYFRVSTRRGLIATIALDHGSRRWFLVERLD